uniref:Peptidase S1 domain-containing protein n=1 Tax=Romanomermis culicivorax TaxID=13658 RepID=A0A915L6L0_ROMCU
MHESYKRDYRYYNDIALIRLEKPVEIGDQIQSLQITSHPTSQMRNCSISGWGGKSGDLTMAFLENNHDIPQANQTAATVSNESNTIFGDSGSAIVCYADGDFFAHGVHSMGYNNTKDIEYANLYMLGPWLKSSLIDLYDITLFHSALHHYAVGGMDSTMAHLEMAYIFLAFMNSAPPGFDIELEVEHVEYRKMWTEHDIGKHILIENDSFNWKNLSGYTLEKDVYHCAIACFIRNNKGSCSYLIATKRCYYSLTNQLCHELSCIRFGYRESVHIHFNQSSIVSRPDSKPLAAKGTEKTRKHNLHPFNCQCDPSVYVSFERRKFHVQWKNWPEVLRSLFINVRINKTTIKQATVQLNYDLTMKYHSGIATLVLDITGMIPFGEVRRTDIGKNNDFISEPRVLYFNVFMGGHQYIPFSRPWMVLLENDSGPVCQGVFIDNSIMGKNLTKLGFVLTTTECADMQGVNIYK